MGSGGGGNPIKTIANGVKGAVNNLYGNPIKNITGNAGDYFKNPLNLIPGVNTWNMAATAFDPKANIALPTNRQPGDPGINPDVSALQQAQLQNAQQFRQGLPGLERDMDTQLKGGITNQLRQGLQATRANNSARGLAYGGVNQGQEQQLRASAQNRAAQGFSQIHSGLLNEANLMDQGAIANGVAIQQQQQQIQNTIYQNAMASMNAQNQIFGSAASVGLLAALVA